jgi:hypothetical protein
MHVSQSALLERNPRGKNAGTLCHARFQGAGEKGALVLWVRIHAAKVWGLHFCSGALSFIPYPVMVDGKYSSLAVWPSMFASWVCLLRPAGPFDDARGFFICRFHNAEAITNSLASSRLSSLKGILSCIVRVNKRPPASPARGQRFASLLLRC